MKMRMFLAAVLAAGLSVAAFAALSPEASAFGSGPAQFLMTKEEAAQWKNVKTDDEANAFIALFWARRDPTPATPQNEFKADFDARVVAADQNFAQGKVKGSMTDRGKALILYGQPKRMVRAENQQQPVAASGNNESAPMSERDNSVSMEWVYEGDEAAAIFGVPRTTLRFMDRNGSGDFRFDRSSVDLKSAQQHAIDRVIVNKNLTAAPTFAASAVPAPQATPAQPAAPVVQTELTTDAIKTAVAAFANATKNPYDKTIYATTGEFVTPSGETFVPVMLYVPKATGLNASSNLTYFGVIQNASGANELAFEEPAKLSESKGDFYVDRSIRLGGGKHHGVFGLAENGKPVAIVANDFETTGAIDKDAAAVSPLMLSNNVYPMTEAQDPDDPFAFGGVKVVPKADRTYHKSDELWYFFELRNPGLAEGTDVPVAGGASAAAQPKIQVKIEVSGTDTAGNPKKFVNPPMEAAAVPMKGMPGHYGVGSSIPLQAIPAGDYTFTIKVIDTVKKASYTISDKFKVVD